MTSNLENLAPKDQFLLWRQEMEAKQEEQARQMAELHEQENRLQEENECMRTRMEVGQAEQSREPPHPFPHFHPGKGKEVVEPDDDLPSGSSPLPCRSPSPNPAEAQSRKRPPRRSICVSRRQVRREPSRDQRPLTPAHQYVLDRVGGFPLPVPSI